MTERAFKGILILLALIGLMVFFQGRAWAGIYVAYDTATPMIVVNSTDAPAKTLAALQDNIGGRLVIYSPGGGEAETTIKGRGTGAFISVGANILSNPDFGAGVTSWTAYGGVTAEAVAGGQAGYCLSQTNVASSGGMYSGITGCAVGALYYFYAYIKTGSAGAVTVTNALTDSTMGVTRYIDSQASTGSWVIADFFATIQATSDRFVLQRTYAANPGDALFDTCLAIKITNPGPSGVFLGPVTARGSFDPNAITKFKILRPTTRREKRRGLGDWKIVWDSAVN